MKPDHQEFTEYGIEQRRRGSEDGEMIKLALVLVLCLVVAWLLWGRRGTSQDLSDQSQGNQPPSAGPLILPYNELKTAIREADALGLGAPPKAVPPTRPTQALKAVLAEKDSIDLISGLLDHAGYRLETQGIGALSEGELAVLSIWALEADVNNGGFDQYFFNSSGDLALHVVASLNLIGAHNMAEIVKRALDAFPDGRPSPDRRERWRQMDQIPADTRKSWDRLTDKFYEYPDPIETLLSRYCRAHPEAFIDASANPK